MNKYWYDQLCTKCPECYWYRITRWQSVSYYEGEERRSEHSAPACRRYGIQLSERNGVCEECDGFQTKAEYEADELRARLEKKKSKKH